MAYLDNVMECRLCLCSAPTVSIHDNPHPLAQRLWTCCRLLVKRGDGFPDAICLSCVNNLELLNSFRNDCRQSNEASKLTLNESLDFKTEELLLEDLNWEDESDVNSPPNNCNDEADEWESSALEKSDSKSPVHEEKDTMCDYTANDIGIPSEELPLLKTFKCDICLKSFAHKRHIGIHMKSHMGEKPFKCYTGTAHTSKPVGFYDVSLHTLKSEEIINFIEDYRSFPLLWDRKNKNYAKKGKRYGAFKVMATKYNMTAEEVKKKIEYLRTYYCKEKKKTIKKNGAGTDETYQSPWFAYDNMSFLSDSTAPRDTIDSIENASAQCEEYTSPSTTNSSQSIQPILTKWNTKPSSIENKREEEAYNFMKTASEMIVNRDECDIFGSIVATKLKKFNLRNRAIMQNYINNYIFQMELQELNNP
ncbi:uncharacterized protein LOC143913024 isoform X2 [Arctopsyche grandis]|uniref:uncharacterized protein LOC143913024 isoform X2 n=1 Tax=Arctopsyche grandis TaxID=121162 RepID=UPI00406D6E24